MTILARVANYFGPLESSIKGFLNVDELFRAIYTALGVSGLVTLLVKVLTAVSSDAAAIFSPSALSMASFALGVILDILRRLDHEATPTAAQRIAACNLLEAVGAYPPPDCPITPLLKPKEGADVEKLKSDFQASWRGSVYEAKGSPAIHSTEVATQDPAPILDGKFGQSVVTFRGTPTPFPNEEIGDAPLKHSPGDV